MGDLSVKSIGANTAQSNTKTATKAVDKNTTVPIVKNKDEDGILGEINKINKVEENIAKDFASGVLTRKEGVSLFGTKLTEDSLVYDSFKYEELSGKELTLGEIRSRYGLEPGVLGDANRFYIGVTSKGEQLDNYTPFEVGQAKVNIPMSAVSKYLNTEY